MTLVAAALAACLIGQVSALDVVFVADAPGAPSVAVRLDNAGPRRTLAWALVGAGPPLAGTSSDDGGARGLLRLLTAPKGASLIERDGALSIGIDDVGPWEEPLQGLAPPPGVPGMATSGPRALRLVVHGGADSGAVPAVLYGARVRIPGRAIVRARRSPPQAEQLRVIVIAGPDAIDVAGTAVELTSTCGRDVPSAVSVVGGGKDGGVHLKLTASGAGACAGSMAVIPMGGFRLEAKKDTPASGVVVLDSWP